MTPVKRPPKKCPKCGSLRTHPYDRWDLSNQDMHECSKCGYVFSGAKGDIHDPKEVIFRRLET